MRTCLVCKRQKPEGVFYKLSSGRTYPYCKPCTKVVVSRRRWAHLAKKGKLQKMIHDTQVRLKHMEGVLRRCAEGKDPVLWYKP
jgi:hypothetical protein